MVSIRWCAAALVAGLVLAGCAAPEEITATARPTREATATATDAPPTATPTATFTPTATASPSPTAGPDLATLLGTPSAQYLNADLEGAADSYRLLADLYPARAEPWLGLAAIAQREGEAAQAIGYLEEATAADAGDYEAWRQLSVLLLQEGRHAEAFEAYTAMIGLAPDSADLYVARAMTAARLGNTETAIEDLQTATDLDPYREYAWLNVVGAAYGTRQYEAAAAVAGAGLDAYPESAALYVQRGLARLSMGEAEGALADFDEALAQNERDYVAHRWRGAALEALDRTEEAIDAYQQAGELGAGSGGLGSQEGYEAIALAARLMAGISPQGAFNYLADKVIQHGQPPPLLMGYALIDYERGNTPSAIGRLDSLIALHEYVPAYYWRGRIAAETGEVAAARADFETYLSLRQVGPTAEDARERLAGLGSDQ